MRKVITNIFKYNLLIKGQNCLRTEQVCFLEEQSRIVTKTQNTQVIRDSIRHLF